MDKKKPLKKSTPDRIICTVQKAYAEVVARLAKEEDRKVNDIVNRLIADGLKHRGLLPE